MPVAKYILMHKNIQVADVNIDNETGMITKINSIMSPEHLPFGVYYRKNAAISAKLNGWWCDRSIPASRSGIENIFEALDIQDSKALLTHCFGLSLSDQYWVKPADADIKWEKVNFFDNPFSEDMGDIMFGEIKNKINFDLCSPDNTSDGCLQKRWKIINGKRCLIKGGSGAFNQQPFNEVIASRIMDRLDIPHVSYSLIWQNEMPYSVCEDFITSETELISAWRVMQIEQKPNHKNDYMHYADLCKKFGIDNIRQSLDRMIVLDYIIANEDRHFNNFGIIRSADNLKWIDSAPIFDSGTSLGYDKLSHRLNTDIKCRPFSKSHETQLHFVTSFDWIDFSKLDDIEDEISEIMSSEQAKAILGDTRHAEISDFMKKRIKSLEQAALRPPAE